MPWVIREMTYREMVADLRVYEPARTIWTVVLGSAFALAVPAFSIGGFVVGAYLVSDIHNLPRVIAGVVVGLGVGQLLSGYLWRRRPWRRLAANRLAVYGAFPTREDGTVWALVGDDDIERTWRVLAEAGLWTGKTANRLSAAPPDAPSLCNRVFITKADGSGSLAMMERPSPFVQRSEPRGSARESATSTCREVRHYGQQPHPVGHEAATPSRRGAR